MTRVGSRNTRIIGQDGLQRLDTHIYCALQYMMKAVPTKMVRFFRAEAIERWHLDEARANSLDGHRDQLITVLQDCYDFSLRRAGAEADEFVRALEEKIQRATHVS